MKRVQYLLIGMVAVFILGCEKVDFPIQPTKTEVVTDSAYIPTIDTAAMNTATRKVLVEELTGHKCTGCPTQTRSLLQLQEDNGHEIIVVSIHAGGFAKVELPKYPEDFTTKFGNDLHDPIENKLSGYPTATINRIEFANGLYLLAFSQWKGPIESVVGTTSPLAMGVAANYVTDSNALYVRVNTKSKEAISGEHRLIVLCLEDSVVAPQLDNGVYDVDYVHRHVLRAQINDASGVNGETIIDATGLAADTWLDNVYKVDLPANVLDPHKCVIVAFVYDTDSGEIVQSEEAHVHVE